METTLKLQSLTFRNVRTYMVACLFVVGNIMMPQLFHLVPNGGITWLPIFFFTLVGACVFGWRVGLLTALASPLVNSLLFGMPNIEMLPVIMMKSAILVGLAGYALWRFGRIGLPVLVGVVIVAQLLGGMGQWVISGDFAIAWRAICVSIPGMLLQIFGGYFVIRYLNRALDNRF